MSGVLKHKVQQRKMEYCTGEMSAWLPCTFCKFPTNRSINGRIDEQGCSWQIVPCCDDCWNGLRQLPSAPGILGQSIPIIGAPK